MLITHIEMIEMQYNEVRYLVTHCNKKTKTQLNTGKILYILAFYHVNRYLLVQETTKPTVLMAQKGPIKQMKFMSCKQESAEDDS